MARMFVTGDCHGETDISKLNTRRFPLQKEMTKEDVMVVLGDWGGIWYGTEDKRYAQKDQHTIKWWDEKPWTTFVVLGNHENYDAIEQLPKTTMFGGPVRKVTDSIVIAETGNIYTLCGKKCLVVNGANSHDMWCRKEGVNWWSQEAITPEAVDKAIAAYDAANGEVDYFFTHACGGVGSVMCGFPPDPSDILIDRVLDHINNGNLRHYCGHMHEDKWVSGITRIVYSDIIMLN